MSRPDPEPATPIVLTDSVILVGGEVLSRLHPEAVCKGRACCVHNVSDHHMSRYRQHFRADKGHMERICDHGVGHPDPDDVDWRVTKELRAVLVHGCDGCCAK